MLVNGSKADLQMTAVDVARSNPVISIKSVGGASEYLARHFQNMHVVPDHTTAVVNSISSTVIPWKNQSGSNGAILNNRMSKRPYPDLALDTGEKLIESIVFNKETFAGLDAREMMVVDLVNPAAGWNSYVGLGDMLMMVCMF